jgi:hypothetical protein
MLFRVTIMSQHYATLHYYTTLALDDGTEEEWEEGLSQEEIDRRGKGI